MSSQTERTVTQAKRRAQAVAGGVAGIVVAVALFVGLFVALNHKSDKSDTTAAAQAPAAESSALPTEEATTAAPEATATASVDIPPALSTAPVVKGGTGTVSKLTVTPLVAGTGPAVKAGQTITVNYVVVTYKDGQTLDSSWSRGQTFSTVIGAGQVIKGWDQAIPGQKVGSRLQIDVPADLAYGAQQGDLRFVVDLLAAK